MEAAAVTDGFTRGSAPLEHAKVDEKTRVLVYGASGSCGTAAVQVGKHYFGAHVTAVCNTKNVELVRSLGADEVIDYLQEDFTRSGETYDVVFDAVGKHSFLRSRRALHRARCLLATDRLYNFPLAWLTKRVGKKKVQFSIERPTQEGRPPAQGADRGREVPRRRRPDVSARGRRRGDPLRRELAEDRERRADDLR